MPAPDPDITDLTDLASVESFLGLSSGNADEAMLQMLITGVSAEIVGYCQRDSFLARASVTENRNGDGQDRLPFLNPPVFAVASVSLDGDLLIEASDERAAGWTFDTDYVYLRHGTPRMGGPFGISRFNRGKQNVEIVYSCGYNTPGQVKATATVTGAPSLPNDLKLSATELVAMRYRQSKRWGETGLSEGPIRVNYFIKAMPESVSLKLNNYKLVAPLEV